MTTTNQENCSSKPQPAAEDRHKLRELFADYKDEYKSEEVDWGQPIGKEVW